MKHLPKKPTRKELLAFYELMHSYCQRERRDVLSRGDPQMVKDWHRLCRDGRSQAMSTDDLAMAELRAEAERLCASGRSAYPSAIVAAAQRLSCAAFPCTTPRLCRGCVPCLPKRKVLDVGG